MNLKIDNTAKESLISLEGELGVQRAEEIKQALLETLQIAEALRVDISHATQFDLTLLQLLYSTARSARAMNKQFTLGENRPEGFSLFLESAGFPEVYPIAENQK